MKEHEKDPFWEDSLSNKAGSGKERRPREETGSTTPSTPPPCEPTTDDWRFDELGRKRRGVA